ncbi:MAG: hypothetical protein ACOX25_02785 [Caldicoprobacterales bacterium]|jgi:hypothetical protein|nr:hypothetical protein [Clostridiales bacterium]
MNTALKLVFFLARKLVGIAIIILLIVLATFIAYDMANIYVVVNDGLSQRAETIIQSDDPADLNRFFTLKYLNSDTMFRSEQFKDYNIQDYNYELKIKKLWVWPWESETEMVVEESIPESSWKFSITEEMRDRLIAAQMPPEQEQDEVSDPDLEEGTEGEENAQTETQQQDQEFELEIPNPYWQNGEKVIELRKVDGHWKIDGIVFVKSIQPEQEASD